MPDDQSKRRLERAQQLFKQYYARCFWHLKPDLVVTDEKIPLIIKGLRNHGDRDAFLAADQLSKPDRG